MRDRQGRSSRPFNPATAADLALFVAVAGGEHTLQGFRNREVRAHLFGARAATGRRRSAQGSRLVKVADLDKATPDVAGEVETCPPLLGHARCGMVHGVAGEERKPRPAVWVGTSLEDLKMFPDEVQDEMGYGIFVAQMGDKHRKAKPLKGFKGGGVLEMISDHRGDTFRAVYTVRLVHAVYVLHAFQKKSKKGIETQKRDMELIGRRLKRAEEMDSESTAGGGS